MGNKEVHAPHCQPVYVPFHITARKLPWIAVPVTGPKAFVGISPSAKKAGRISAAFRHHRIHARIERLFRSHPAQSKILPRYMKILLRLYIIALMRMSHQGNPVILAPLRQASVINLLLPLPDQASVKSGVFVFFALKEFKKAGKPSSRRRVAGFKSLRPGQHIPHIPSQNTWLICKNSDDCGSKPLPQLPVIGLMGKLQELFHRLRI